MWRRKEVIMSDFPVFLLPKGDVMTTARVVGNKVELLNELDFPLGSKCHVTNTGLAVCLDINKQLVRYGQFTEEGELIDCKEIVVDIIEARCISIAGDFIIIAGAMKSGVRSHKDKVIGYSISKQKFYEIELPPVCRKGAVKELLTSGSSTVLALYDSVEQKSLVKISIFGGSNFEISKVDTLVGIGSSSLIEKAVVANNYITLLSLVDEKFKLTMNLNIHRMSSLNEYTQLSMPSYTAKLDFGDKHMDRYQWVDVFLTQDERVLLIPSLKGGLGLYEIKDELIMSRENLNQSKPSEDTELIGFVKFKDRSVLNVLKVPDSPEKVIVVCIDKNSDYTYSVRSIEKLLGKILTSS